MARRLAFAILLIFGMLLPIRGAAAVGTGPAGAQHAYHSQLFVLASVICLELLLIVLLLHTRSKSRSAQTALLRKEEELRKSEEKFSKAFRQGPMAVILISAATQRYIDVNETYERLTGYGREEVLGRDAADVGLCVDPNEGIKLTQKLLAERRLRDVEFHFRRKDGAIRLAQASAELIEIAGEQCLLGVAADITERKQVEQALAESEERFRLIADSAPVLMWLTNPDKDCTDVNRGWLRFTGRTMQQELGSGWVQSVHTDDAPSFLDAYSVALDAKESFTAEHRLRRFDGEYRWMRNNAVPRFLGNGDFAGYIGCCVDITDEREAKATRAEFSGRLIHAQEEERTRIARELHDDINQRLALLANGVERIIQVNGDYTKAEQTKELRELGQLTNEIATDIQHMSHQLHPSKLHYLGLGAAVRDLCREFSRQHGIGVECNVGNLPRDLDDEVRLSLFRTVQESLRNVARHSQAREVKVELIYDSADVDAAVVKLRIDDDGIGFDPRQSRNNTGLGLVSMRERLRSVGGQFRIWSRPGVGTQVEGIVPNRPKRNRNTHLPVE